MSTLTQIFATARAERRGLVLPFFTGGDPTLDMTPRLLDAAEQAGVEIAEIGIPFSDPIADGPVIAQAMHEALARGVTPARVLTVLASRRSGPATMAMVSMSIVHRMGSERFVDVCRASGVAGLIVPDADIAVADTLAALCDAAGLACVFLVAPNTSGARLERIVRLCRGFVYLLARAGITGESAGVPEIAGQVQAIRAIRPELPIAAGFGIATADQVRAVVAHADAAIVGSALVRQIRAELTAGRDPIPAVRSLLMTLVDAAKSAPACSPRAQAQTHSAAERQERG